MRFRTRTSASNAIRRQRQSCQSVRYGRICGLSRDTDRQAILRDNPGLSNAASRGQMGQFGFRNGLMDAAGDFLSSRQLRSLPRAERLSEQQRPVPRRLGKRCLAAMGVGKRPVAAGRASGNLDFIIEPGKPDRSILISRMKSTDPGIAMPELGRATAHVEAIQLLEKWIGAMPESRKSVTHLRVSVRSVCPSIHSNTESIAGWLTGPCSMSDSKFCWLT